jgi:hypothetical protein
LHPIILKNGRWGGEKTALQGLGLAVTFLRLARQVILSGL